jgi:hypothetical protein
MGGGGFGSESLGSAPRVGAPDDDIHGADEAKEEDDEQNDPRPPRCGSPEPHFVWESGEDDHHDSRAVACHEECWSTSDPCDRPWKSLGG